MVKHIVLLSMVLLSVFIYGCTNSSSDKVTEPLRKSVAISESDLEPYKDGSSSWPLTVNSGYIDCYSFNDCSAWFFRTTNGVSYPVNGLSQSCAKRHNMYNDIYNIWMDAGGGLKINIGRLIDTGNAICNS